MEKWFWVVTESESADNEAGYVKRVLPHGYVEKAKASAALLRQRDYWKKKGWKEFTQEIRGVVVKSVLRYPESTGEMILALEQWQLSEGFV